MEAACAAETWGVRFSGRCEGMAAVAMDVGSPLSTGGTPAGAHMPRTPSSAEKHPNCASALREPDTPRRILTVRFGVTAPASATVLARHCRGWRVRRALLVAGVGPERRYALVRASVSARLQPHQRVGVRWLFKSLLRGGGLLADEPGLGKTLQTIALVAAVADMDVHVPNAAGDSIFLVSHVHVGVVQVFRKHPQ